MLIEQALRGYLATHQTLTNVLGLAPARIFGSRRPQGSPLPAIVFRRVGGGHGHNLAAASGYANAGFELECWAATYDGALDLAARLRSALDGFGPGLYGDTKVRGVLLDDENDLYEIPIDGSDSGAFCRLVRYTISADETIPSFA